MSFSPADDEIDYEPAVPAVAIAMSLNYKNTASGGSERAAATAQKTAEPSGKRARVTVPEDAPASRADRECDEERLASRQKQIEFGKNTVGYERYLSAVPKAQRKRGHPRTPDKLQICSRRSWNGQIVVWRRSLHAFDPQ